MGVDPLEAIQNLEEGVLKSIAPDENAWGKTTALVQSELEIEIHASKQAFEVADSSLIKVENDIRETKIILADMESRRKEMQFIRDAKNELVKTLTGAVI